MLVVFEDKTEAIARLVAKMLPAACDTINIRWFSSRRIYESAILIFDRNSKDERILNSRDDFDRVLCPLTEEQIRRIEKHRPLIPSEITAKQAENIIKRL